MASPGWLLQSRRTAIFQAIADGEITMIRFWLVNAVPWPSIMMVECGDDINVEELGTKTIRAPAGFVR